MLISLRSLVKCSQENKRSLQNEGSYSVDPRDLGLEGTNLGSNRFIIVGWQTPFGCILSSC